MSPEELEPLKPRPLRIPNTTEGAAAAGALLLSTMFSIGSIGVLARSTDLRMDLLQSQIDALGAQLDALSERLDQTRDEFFQYLNQLVLIDLGNRVFSLQEEVRLWGSTGDILGVSSNYGASRTTQRQMNSYLLQPPPFISDETYLVLEELNLVLVTTIANMDIILGRRSQEDLRQLEVVTAANAEGDRRQRTLIHAAIRPVDGEFDAQHEQGQSFYRQEFGYSEIDGRNVRVALASAEVSGGRFAEWQQSLSRARAKVDAAVAERRTELYEQARAPLSQQTAAALEMFAKMGDIPNSPLADILETEA